MDRRFFENDNLEDLSKDESPKSFQKIDEEDEVICGVMKRMIFHQKQI